MLEVEEVEPRAGRFLTRPVQLFLLSFIALFLELTLIRWVPSIIRLVAYYSNLLLISSFLGLGLGALLARSRRNLFLRFPLILALDIAYLLICKWGTLPGSSAEARFFYFGSGASGYAMLIGVFILNSLTFLPLGQQIGLLFEQQQSLRAYMWDLCGSLSGTLAFGIFSYGFFSPALGMILVGAIFLLLTLPRHLLSNLALFSVCAGALFFSGKGAMWSPYYYVTIEQEHLAPNQGVSMPNDPPLYIVRVNQDFYQLNGTIDFRRYDPKSPWVPRVRGLREQYFLPYALRPSPKRVLVLGSGGGMDVEAALLAGAEVVDAVDIDPMLINLSHRLNAGSVYDNPRVHVHVTDARAFLQSAQPGYDMVIFGFLDSQALASYMSNVRLDGYIYTVEGLRRAYQLLNPNGLMSISFATSRNWLAPKLRNIVLQATGKEPIAYASRGRLILCATNGQLTAIPNRIESFQRGLFLNQPIPAATDDWPYLYLRFKTIPSDYLVVISILLALSIASVLLLRKQNFGIHEIHFLFLGLGFLLLETKSISDCGLYFGTTWFVTMLVVSGVLLMVLASNAVAQRMHEFRVRLYIPLFASLLLLYLIPREIVLGFSFQQRLLWTIFVVPLPLFFAGLIFSTTLKLDSAQPAIGAAALFGANLIGATIGGFSEYLGMAIGLHQLMLIVFAAYGASLCCRLVLFRNM